MRLLVVRHASHARLPPLLLRWAALASSVGIASLSTVGWRSVLVLHEASRQLDLVALFAHSRVVGLTRATMSVLGARNATALQLRTALELVENLFDAHELPEADDDMHRAALQQVPPLLAALTAAMRLRTQRSLPVSLNKQIFFVFIQKKNL